MILLDQVCKSYRGRDGRKAILSSVSMAFPADRNIGILGGNGVGKSTLLRLLGGAEPPDSGTIRRYGRVSFPLGFSGTFHGALSGRENALFLARVYGADARRLLDFVGDFAELGADLDMPVETYSSGMVSKLAFAVSLAIDFDVYLVDEATEVGDARFRARSAQAFRDRLGRASLILVSHNSTTIRALCDCCAILQDGGLHPYASVDEAMRRYIQLLGVEDA